MRDFKQCHNKRDPFTLTFTHRATYKATGETFKIKSNNISHLDSEMYQNFVSEIESISHPNIVQLKETIETNETFYIVNEETSGLLFKRIIEKSSQSYTEGFISSLIRNLVQALDYLHDKNISHLDVLPENLYLKFKKEQEERNIDIEDELLLEMSISKLTGSETLMSPVCRIPVYVSPECLKGNSDGKESDMWSVGVICYVLLCGFPPFYSENIPELFTAIISADFDYPDEYWRYISDSAIDFIDCLLVEDPAKRMSAKDALQHRWLQVDEQLPGSPQQIPLEKSFTKLKEYLSSLDFD